MPQFNCVCVGNIVRVGNALVSALASRSNPVHPVIKLILFRIFLQQLHKSPDQPYRYENHSHTLCALLAGLV